MDPNDLTAHLTGRLAKAHATGYPLEGRMTFQGLDISIEQKAGSIRRGKGRDGTEWATRMTYPYGYIRLTEGVDGDHLDCYVGPNEHADTVWIVDQVVPETGAFDEQKVMLGFSSEGEARAAYLLHYDDPRGLGRLRSLPMAEFKAKALARGSWGRMVKAHQAEDDGTAERGRARARLEALTAEMERLDHSHAKLTRGVGQWGQQHHEHAAGLARVIRDPGGDGPAHEAYLDSAREAQRARALQPALERRGRRR